MLIGRLAGSGAAFAVGALIALGCGNATADATDLPGQHPTTSSREPHAGPKSPAATRRNAAPQRQRPSPARRGSASPTPIPAGRRAGASKPDTVNLASYWPTFSTGEIRRFDYTSPDGSLAPTTSVFQYDPVTKSMLYKEFDAAMQWRDTWYYRPAPRYGIAEWRDDYPQTNPALAALVGPVKKVVLSIPIGWGADLTVGGTYRNRPVFAFFRSAPAKIGSGRQVVTLEAILADFTTRDGTTFHDVAQFVYQQRWGFGPPAGARYWMAKGVGPVAIQWVGEDPKTHQPIESVRLDAVVTITR